MDANGLTLRPFYWRPTNLFGEKAVVSPTNRYTYERFGERVAALASALDALGVEPGDRVGTLAWNTHRHLEAFFAVPLMGAQLHTINANLAPEKMAYVVDDADDAALLVGDGQPLSAFEAIRDDVSVDEVVVMGDEAPSNGSDDRAYEPLLDAADPDYEWPTLAEEQPAGLCYTSGSTGDPKGVEYTHKMTYAYAMMLMTPAAADIAESDVVMPVVPMFHVNSWMLPYAATMAGAKQVYPGPKPSAARIADLIESEGVTVAHGVPTVWIDLLGYLDGHQVDLSSLDRIVTGGFAAPESLIRRYDEYGVTVEHTWGMTETMSLACASRPKSTMDDWDAEERLAKRVKQGLLAPGYEMKVVDDDGERVPWDGSSRGELLVRGPTVADEYYQCPAATEADFEDGGWLRTGDVVTVDAHGYIQIVDRRKDLIKSGGEWISSIELENRLMAHEDVVEAAVVAVSHERWHERPLACVNLGSGADADERTLREFLAADFPRWWLPDSIVFVEEVPKNSTGKFDKQALAERFADAPLRWTPGEQKH